MTLRESIRQVDEMRPNTIADKTKREWLISLDGSIRAGVMDGAKTETGADVSAQDEAELLVPQPYSTIYRYWLAAEIDLELGELVRYANDMALYNAALSEYAAYWRKTHLPAKRGQFRL